MFETDGTDTRIDTGVDTTTTETRTDSVADGLELFTEERAPILEVLRSAGNFKDVESLAKSYSELRKLASSKTGIKDAESYLAYGKANGYAAPLGGAPEAYEGMAELFEANGAVSDDDILRDVSELMRSAGVSQEQAAALLPEVIKSNVDSFKAGYEAALGDKPLPYDANAVLAELDRETNGKARETFAPIRKLMDANPGFKNFMTQPLATTPYGWIIAKGIADKFINQGKPFSPGEGGSRAQAEPKDALMDSLHQIKQHPALRDSNHPQHKEVYEKFQKLVAMKVEAEQKDILDGFKRKN